MEVTFMAKSKLTIDLKDENKIILENLKNETGNAYGSTINDLIKTFAYLPANVKKEFMFFASSKIRRLYREMEGAGELNAQVLSAEIHAYSLVRDYFKEGELPLVDRSDIDSTLIKVFIKDGIFVCPSTYILLNYEEAKDSPYACIVECRNSKTFGYKHFGEPIPHFVYFCSTKYAENYDNSFCEMVKKACVRVWPKFDQVLESQVEPIDDPDNFGEILNAEQWYDAPTIGLFAAYEQGDTKFGPKYKPPAGVHIVRMTKRR